MDKLFRKASPIWAEGRENEMNLFISAVTRFEHFRGKATARIACCTAYHLYVNGKFAAYGPARCGEGYFRVDEVDISGLTRAGTNEAEIVVAGYNQPSYEYVTMQPSFLCAELEVDGTVAAATGSGGFEYKRNGELAQRVQRYTYQRCFSENHTLPAVKEPIAIAPTGEKKFVPRRIPQAVYSFEGVAESLDRGSAVYSKKEDDGEYPWGIKCVLSSEFPGYRPEEMEVYNGLECSSLTLESEDASRRFPGKTVLKNSYETFRLRCEQTGLITMKVRAKRPAKIFVMFSEYQKDEFPAVGYRRIGQSSVIWNVGAGTHELLSFEPYSVNIMQIAAVGGECEIESAGVLTVGFRPVAVRMISKDPALRDVTAAAVNTFRQNACDIFMDCPSRERAGWLCDSFFTSRVEYLLTGKNETEYNFLENFLLPEKYSHLPDGMLPMCYPSDHMNGRYIPNWAMFFVLEVAEHKKRNPDSDLPELARDRIYKLLGFFEKYENESGLLEKLESWVFVEWSHANELVQDVNYPTNMLYSMTLRAVSELYGDAGADEKSARIADRIREQSFNGRFFTDNAVRKQGKLIPTGEITEACQYYAFFTGVATRERYPELFDTLIRDFGPSRAKTGKYPEVWQANAFVGNYLRLEMMMNEGFTDEAIADIRAFFKPMADQTGTLWENMTDHASCNHGFASHVLVWLDKAGCIAPGVDKRMAQV